MTKLPLVPPIIKQVGKAQTFRDGVTPADHRCSAREGAVCIGSSSRCRSLFLGRAARDAGLGLGVIAALPR